MWRKLRILFVEVIGFGLVLGWLMWKYPELVDDIIPWIAFFILWHLTWEYVLDTKPVRRLAQSLSRKIKPMVAWPLIFLIGGGISIGYWYGINKSLARLARMAAKRAEESRREPPKAEPSPEKATATDPAKGTEAHGNAAPHTKTVFAPYQRTESFIIDVPYYGGDDGFPVHALLDVDEYPLNDAYQCLAGILLIYREPEAKVQQIAALDTIQKRSEALVEALRYCVIETLHQTERGSSKFGISVKKGSIAAYKPAIPPPNSTDYPPQQFFALLSALPFGNNDRIKILYQNRPLRVPKGSNVELLKLKIDANDWVEHWGIRIRKADVFSLVVGVAPINAAIGVVPESFPEQYRAKKEKYVTYSFAITMKIQIERTSTNAPQVEDYKHWSDGIWSAIRDKFDIKQHQTQ